MTKWKNTATRCLQEEAQAILNIIPLIDEGWDRAIDIMLACRGKVVTTGVGKSGHIARKMAATFSSTGTPSFYVSPLDLYHGDLGAIQGDDVVIAISNSGQTDELLRIVPNLQERNIPIIGMSSRPDSLLARYAAAHIYIKVEKEASPLGLAPTCSTTATLAVGDALACCLIEARQFRDTDFARYHPGGALGRRLLTKACDVMIKDNLPVLQPETRMGEALIAMTAGRLGICIAMRDGRVEGIVTDGDLRRAVESSKERFLDLTVEDIMTRRPKTVGLHTRIDEIDRMMNTYKIHCVLVVDEQWRLLGVVDSFSTVL